MLPNSNVLTCVVNQFSVAGNGRVYPELQFVRFKTITQESDHELS